MSLMPGDDCAKAVLQRAKPWEAGRSQNEEWGGTGPWEFAGCLVCVAWPPAETRMEHAKVSAQGHAGKYSSD